MDVEWSYGARGAVVGATALAVAGFMWGGWVTGGSAEATVLKRSQSAVVAVRTPICIEMPGQCRCFDEARGVEEHQRFMDAPGLHRERRIGDLPCCAGVQNVAAAKPVTIPRKVHTRAAIVSDIFDSSSIATGRQSPQSRKAKS